MDDKDYLEKYSFTDIEASPMAIGIGILFIIIVLCIIAC